MPDLNLRNLDVTLVTKLKADAALAHLTLRAHCIRLLGGVNGNSDSEPARSGSAQQTRTSQRTGNRTAVPTVRKAKSKAERLHPVQPVRDELARGREHHGQPESRTLAEVHAGHQTYKAGEQQYCATCKSYF